MGKYKFLIVLMLSTLICFAILMILLYNFIEVLFLI